MKAPNKYVFKIERRYIRLENGHKIYFDAVVSGEYVKSAKEPSDEA